MSALAVLDIVPTRHTFDHVEAPLLALWGRHSFVGRHHDVLDIWNGYARDVRGEALECDHYLPQS